MEEPEFKRRAAHIAEEDGWDGLKLFRPYHSALIEKAAAGLSIHEALGSLGYRIEDLVEGSVDLDFFMHYFTIGRENGKINAVSSLFESMKGKGGGQIALAYLARFSEKEWNKEIGDTIGQGKTLRILMSDE